MLTRPLLATIALLGLSCSPPGTRLGSDQGASWRPRLERYAAMLDSAGFSGVILARGPSGAVSRFGLGFADEARAIPNGADIAFDIGSITKQFTAAAILRLEASGSLRVTDSIARHLGTVPTDKRAITIHQLLTHTAGFPEAIGQDYEPVGRDEFVAAALATPLRHAPGSGYLYSNVGYSLLAAIIELRSGVPYDHYLRRELFAPVGMGMTGYRTPTLTPDRVATGFGGSGVWGRPNERRWDTDGPFWHLRGNGGILSTANDMLRWHDALAAGRVLTTEQQARMYARHTEEGAGAGTYYGYGWALFPTPRGTTLITHNGGNGIFFADFLRYPTEEVVVFVASNRAQRRFRDVAQEVARIVLDSTYVPPAISAAAAPAATAAIPETDVGRLVSRFLEAVRRNDATVGRALVERDYAPALVRAAPMERHLAILGRLHETIGRDAIVRRVVITEEQASVDLVSPEGRGLGLLTLVLSRQADGSWRIGGVSLEDGR